MKAIIYAFSKYIEIGSLALVNLILAEKVSPSELGLLMPILIFITYSNYTTFGAPQLILKFLPRKIKSNSKLLLLDASSKLLSAGFLITLIAAFTFIELKYSLIVFFISSSTLFSSYIAAKLRVDFRFLPINIANITSAACLLSLTFFYVQNISTYLIALSIAKALMVIIYVSTNLSFSILTIQSIFKKINIRFFKLYSGAALTMTTSSILFTLIMSVDRLAVQWWDLDSATLGVYQLADTIGMAFYLVVNTFFFYFYPIFLKKINNDKVFEKKYLKILFISTIFPLFFYYPSSVLLEFFKGFLFSEYKKLWDLVPILISLKSAYIIYSMLLTFYISKSKDIKAIAISFILLIVLILLSVFLAFYNKNEYTNIPIFFSFVILLLSAGLIYYEYRKNKNALC